MNIFEESEILNSANEKLKSIAFDSTIDYKPMNDNLPPSSYAEHGYLRGSQETLERLISLGIINIGDIRKFAKEA